MNNWLLWVLVSVAAITLIGVVVQTAYAQVDCIIQCTEDWIAADYDYWDRYYPLAKLAKSVGGIVLDNLSFCAYFLVGNIPDHWRDIS